MILPEKLGGGVSSASRYLLGLSEGNAQVETSALFCFRSVANRSQVVNTQARSYVHSYNDPCDKRMAFFNGERSEDPAAVLVRTNTVYNTPKAHTKDAHTVCGGPTQKDVERFRKNRSANFMRDVLISKLTFLSEVIDRRTREPCYIKAI